MSDLILIRDLHLRCIIGIHEWEREKRQDVLVNIELEADCAPAGASDDFSDAVDYRALSKKVINLVEESDFFLVEKMAEEIAALCLADPRVEVARVRVEKPGALRFARSVGVEVERRQA
jgi:dihydroneopterin aldolase/D-erythro-7,8-dihydroneopterin triphosphate epimerase